MGIDRIELDQNTTLTAALPNITTTMIIDGNGYTITGGGSDSDFRLVEITGGTVTLDGDDRNQLPQEQRRRGSTRAARALW